MKIKCSFCPTKTDELKLQTLRGRGYLLCKTCDRWSHYDEETMKKTGLLSLISQLKIELEETSEENKQLVILRSLDALLDYINDPQIREAIEELPF